MLLTVLLSSVFGGCLKDVDFDQVDDFAFKPELETGLVYVDTLTSCELLNEMNPNVQLCDLIPVETINVKELTKLPIDTDLIKDIEGIIEKPNPIEKDLSFDFFSEKYVVDHLESASLVFEVGSTFNTATSVSVALTGVAEENPKRIEINLEPSRDGVEYTGRDTLKYSAAEIDQLKKVDHIHISVEIEGLEELDKKDFIRLKSMAFFQLGINVKKGNE
ncbi:hypothetical protein [Sinomicrobium sp.]